MRDRTDKNSAAVDDDSVLDRALASLGRFSPTPGFEDRVMARVGTPAPMWIQRLKCRGRFLAETGRLWWLLGGVAGTLALSLSGFVTLVVLNGAGVRESLNSLLTAVGLPAWRALLGVTVQVTQDACSLINSVALPGAIWAAIAVGGSLTLLFNTWMICRLTQPAKARTVKLNAPH
ncbi:MAG: hypothetical protein JSW71_15520 [Gemmatimonadota bacterium]|nr:MAG: hypothetical protein JSW71_15520 [Gemmatimonadota bacterium]